MLRFIFLLMLTAGLAGCSSMASSPEAGRSLDQMVESTPQIAAGERANAPVARAMVMLAPAAGAIDKITSQTFSDGVQQVISYDHPVIGLKPNEIRLSLMTPAAASTLEPSNTRPMSRERPSEAGIKSALASEFPRMAMRIMSTPRNNDYGVYGLAIGQWANGARCIYAWQWIDALPSADSSTSASLRIRLCRSDMTLDQLANLVDHLKIDPTPRPAATPLASAPPALPKQAVAVQKPAAASPPSHAPAQRVAQRAPVLSLALRAQTIDVPSDLDPTLPAAAFRGPSANSRIISQ